MADMATAMIRMLLVNPASTAAVPITIPPTIPIVCPILEGRRAPASRSSSKVVSINKASRTGGKGTRLRDSDIEASKFCGIIS
ncbi:hypothetical protein D3C76_1443210 [compost metagenome]